jgi:hypothetical protein
MSAVLTESAARIARRIPSGTAPGSITAPVEALARDVAGALSRQRLLKVVLRVPLVACTITVTAIWVAKGLSELPPSVGSETKIQRPRIGAAIQASQKNVMPSTSDLEIQFWLAKSMQDEVVLETQREVVGEAMKNAARELEQARIAALAVAKSQQTDASVKTTGEDPRRKIEGLNARIERLTIEAAELHVRWQRNRQERMDTERALRSQD